jgi:hypothetical protein
VQKRMMIKYSCLICKIIERTSIEVVTKKWSSSKVQYNLVLVQKKISVFIVCIYCQNGQKF